MEKSVLVEVRPDLVQKMERQASRLVSVPVVSGLLGESVKLKKNLVNMELAPMELVKNR